MRREASRPLAALRLKQGFGRLIRTRTDRGVVTILDPRIVTRRYGRFLLDSLPRCPVEVMGGAEAGILPEPPEPPEPGGEGPPEGTGEE